MEIDPRILDDKGITGAYEISDGVKSGSSKAALTDSGLSSIEKSKGVMGVVIPAMDAPALSAPSNVQEVAFAVQTKDAQGNVKSSILLSSQLKEQETVNKMLDSWAANLRAISEEIRQRLGDPLYIQLQEILLKGDPRQGVIAGVASPTAAQAVAGQNATEQGTTIGSLMLTKRLTPPSKADETQPQDKGPPLLVFSLAATMLAGGGLALAGIDPLSRVVEFVQGLQALVPSLNVQDIVPLINLLVLGPIYAYSWNEAVGRLANKERSSYQEVAHQFAKDVIKIVSNPEFILKNLVNTMQGADRLTPEIRERLNLMFKVILCGVALSLLYATEVGKVQDGKFGGMTSEEFKALLNGEFAPELEKGEKLSEHEQLVATLIKQARYHLSVLSAEDRLIAVEQLLDYVFETKELDPMLEPAKVFKQTMGEIDFPPPVIRG